MPARWPGSWPRPRSSRSAPRSRQLPTTLPGDDAALAARLLAAYVSTVGLGIGTAGAALRAMGL
ncbi:hypothetical protein, partial [Mycolicibacterium insubricum]|uniref:hypothetical protein n=1 Tax=Mycolicibacterium insubricum TaxID=444597 RepID=UPI0021F2689C